MAKKRSTKEMQTIAEPETGGAAKPVRVDLPPDVHRLLRLVAAAAGVSMAAYARDGLTTLVRSEAKRLGLRSER